MSSVDLICQLSIPFTNHPGGGVESYIWMGTKNRYMYWSYLYFDLDEIPRAVKLSSATLVMFKIPEERMGACHNYYPESLNRYRAIPSAEYVSAYTYCYEVPILHDERTIFFHDIPKRAYTEIDITKMAEAWIKGEIENKGMMITAECNSKWIRYESNNAKEYRNRPFLRVVYEDKQYPYPDLHEPIIELPLIIKRIE